MFATSAESLKLWEIQDNRQIFLKAALSNPKTQEFHAPLTSFDWSEMDPSLVGTCSVDTTCTIWNIEVGRETVLPSFGEP